MKHTRADTVVWSNDAGQALTEYAVIVAVVVGALFFTSANFLPTFVQALQNYYDSYYTVLNLPVP